MAASFWAMQPGPKMLWQFGELGYDSTINACGNGTPPNAACRLSPKPIKWDYKQNADRLALYDIYSKLFKLRNTPEYLSTFTTGTIDYLNHLSGLIKWFSVSDNALKVMVFGNFDVTTQSTTVTFPAIGVWYNYFTGATLNVNSAAYSITLQPGEYYVYTNKSVVLPVNLLSFTANKTDKHTVIVNWSTSSEINNHHYEVERSGDGSSFATLGSVAASAALTQVKQYQYIDLKPLNGVNYYRLKQVDKDGQFHYSAVVKINFTTQNVLWQLYPNPAGSSTAIYAQATMNKIQVVLTDISGKILYRNNTVGTVTAGQKINIPVKNLSKGVYLLKVTTDQGIQTEKLAVE